MPVTIVCGGQYGSEGKGKAALYFGRKYGATVAVRVGGPNSGHIVVDDDGNKVTFRVLPVMALKSEVMCVLPAGSYINIELLKKEMEMAHVPDERVKIHPNAVILTGKHSEMEHELHLDDRISSTLSGTGAGVGMRVMRDPRLLQAGDCNALQNMVCDTADYLRKECDKGHMILIEGTQGFGLSNLHTPHFPYATSRDTTAAGFLMETGLSPFDVLHIVLTLRMFPIRVAGDSGPLPFETSWQCITAKSGRAENICERTSVTDRIRRVAQFDPQIVRQAIVANRPDIMVLNHVDYVHGGKEGSLYLNEQQRDAVSRIEKELEWPINYVGTGPSTFVPW